MGSGMNGNRHNDSTLHDFVGSLEAVTEGKVMLELKAVEQLAKVHPKQLFTYPKLTDKWLGLLLNFGADLMKEGIKRIANGMEYVP
jgi:GxxExxY protein